MVFVIAPGIVIIIILVIALKAIAHWVRIFRPKFSHVEK